MSRSMNFNAGPAALPLEALERARQELTDFGGTGMSILEHSHRGAVYEQVHEEAIALVRELLGVGDAYHVLLLQGGGSHQFAMVPMNLLRPGRRADYVVTGYWGQKAFEEVQTVGAVRAAGPPLSRPARVPRPSELNFDPAAAYVHITSNETIDGCQWREFPATGKVPLVADMASDILTRSIDVSRFGLIYAGAQKNMGPSGVTVVIVRKDLVESARTDIPIILRYSSHAKDNSIYNTPPTLAIYLLRNVLDALKQGGGVAAAEQQCRHKARLLYDAIDARPDFYLCPVDREARSLSNVVFRLPTPALEAEFLATAEERGMFGLKGHRSVGGIRASIYNGVEVAWVNALAAFMTDFHARA